MTERTNRYSTARVLDGWYAACRSDDLHERPISRTLFDLPVALFRDGRGRAAALLDRCAHRNAPLSLGTVDGDGHLACLYHGWRFDGGGKCRKVPGLIGEIDSGPGRSVPAFAARESDGFVWIWARADAEPAGEPPRIPHCGDPEYLVVVREYDVECTLHAALENALDVPHTAFVHRGDFRGKGAREITAVRRRIPDGIEVEYLGEPPLSGATTDAEGRPIVAQHWDRFVLPSLAQVEYRSPGRHLISTLPHTPIGDFRTRFWLVSCWRVPAEKRAEMGPVIEKQLDTILGQDVEILRAQTRRIRELGGESYRSTALDLMGPEILRMLREAERGAPADSAPIDRTVKLQVF